MIIFHISIILVAFIMIGSIFNVILSEIVSHKRSNHAYKSLLTFIIAQFVYGSCMIIIFHETTVFNIDIATIISVITNFVFIFICLSWGSFLFVNAENKKLGRWELVISILSAACAILWTIDSLVFIDRHFVVVNQAGNIISTAAEVVFVAAVILWFTSNLRKKGGGIQTVCTILLSLYMVHILYTDIGVSLGNLTDIIEKTSDVKSYLIYCATMNLLIMLFLLKHISHELTYNDDDIIYLTEEELSLRFKITSREIEVLQLIYAGKSNDEISNSLFITINTVKKHISSIFKKMDVTSRVDLLSKYALSKNVKTF